MTRSLAAPLALILALPSCGNQEDNGGQAPDIHTVERSDLRITVREQGEIQAASNTQVRSQLEGSSTVISLVPEGTVVAKGDLLAELDVSDIEDKRANQAITVAKAEAALNQAVKRFEIMERQLKAAENTAESDLAIAEIRQEKFIGQSVVPKPVDGSATAGTNREMLLKLRALLESEFIENPAAEINYSDLVNEVMELLTEENVALEMGEMANQILKQIDQISLARSDLELARDTLTHSENLFAKNFITRNELQRDTISHDRFLSQVTVAWNDLELLIKYTQRENKISLAQEIYKAELNLESVRADNESTRVREEAELISARAEYELAAERLANWDQQIANAVILAPTPGLVVYHREGGGMGRPRDPVEEGMQVRERQVLINLPDVTSMTAELKVHEAQVNKVALSQAATISIDAFPERTFTGRVNFVAPLPDSGSMFLNDALKVYKTTVILEGGNEDQLLRPGLTATVEIHIDVLEDVISVPLPALQRQGVVHYVWKINPEGAVATPVQVGVTNTTHVEITSGLEEGDRVYLAPLEGAEPPEFEQPEKLVPEPGAPILTGEAAAMDASMGSTGSETQQATRMGSGGGMDMASGMQFIQQLREVLVKELPQYSDQLGDNTGLFRLLGDSSFQRAVEGALDSAPELRAQWERVQQMMSSMGGRGSESGRSGSGRRGGQP